jgi:hypothetical protein
MGRGLLIDRPLRRTQSNGSDYDVPIPASLSSGLTAAEVVPKRVVRRGPPGEGSRSWLTTERCPCAATCPPCFQRSRSNEERLGSNLGEIRPAHDCCQQLARTNTIDKCPNNPAGSVSSRGLPQKCDGHLRDRRAHVTIQVRLLKNRRAGVLLVLSSHSHRSGSRCSLRRHLHTNRTHWR